MTSRLGICVLLLTLAWAVNSLGAVGGSSSMQTSVSESSDRSRYSLRNQFEFDIAPALGGAGYGLNYLHRFGQVQVGAFYSTRTSNDEYILFSTAKWTQKRAGLESRYLFREVSQSGPYLGASVFQYEIQGKGSFGILGYKLPEAESEKYTGTGWGAKAGWLWSSIDHAFGRIVFDLGMTYEKGNNYSYEASYSTGSKGSLKITEVAMGLGLTAALGIQF